MRLPIGESHTSGKIRTRKRLCVTSKGILYWGGKNINLYEPVMVGEGQTNLLSCIFRNNQLMNLTLNSWVF